MALEASGTQTATVTTEHTLSTLTVDKVLVFEVDTANMVAGDVVELRVKGKTLTGGTERLYIFAAFYGAQNEPKKVCLPIKSDIEAVFTLKQTFGTGRQFAWKVNSI